MSHDAYYDQRTVYTLIVQFRRLEYLIQFCNSVPVRLDILIITYLTIPFHSNRVSICNIDLLMVECTRNCWKSWLSSVCNLYLCTTNWWNMIYNWYYISSFYLIDYNIVICKTQQVKLCGLAKIWALRCMWQNII